MANRQADQVLRGLHTLVEEQSSQLTDGQLLHRFSADRDERAFATLLQRHGALVYGVCRNILRHEHDAEDAFQGTFLVLARRAAVIRHEKAVASWLYRVAYRVAMKAKAASDRRRRREEQVARPTEDRPVGDLAWRELQAMLDAELNRLPDKYRAPFVLCCLTGKSKAEAAADLGWKEGTVSSRLAKAREVLQRRLARRGVTLSAVLSGLAISQPGASALVPATLLTATRQMAVAFAAGGRLAGEVAAGPASLARAVLRGMTAARLGLPVVALVVLGLASTAAVVALDQPTVQVAPVASDPDGDRSPAALVEPAPDGLHQLIVRGRVIGSDGKAIPGADIAILADENRPAGDREFSSLYQRRIIVSGKADTEGKFQFVTPRPRVGQDQHYYCLAAGAGQTVAWRMLQTLVEEPEFDLKLKAGQRVRGRLVDDTNSPAVGVKLRVGGFGTPEQTGLGPGGLFNEEIAVAAWPASQVTNRDGNFAFDGLPPRATVHLAVRDDRYCPQWLTLKTGEDGPADAGTIKLEPPRTLEGRVVAADSMQPLANAIVDVTSAIRGAPILGSVRARTDANGRFTVKPYPGPSVTVTAGGAPGTPFLAARQDFEWPAGARQPTVEVKLQRGVLQRGVVVEQGRGLPVPGARIQYRPMSGKNRNGDEGNLLTLWHSLDTSSDANGQFEIPVLPGLGHLLVRGPGHDFISMEVSEYELIYGRKGGGRAFFPDALVPLTVERGGQVPPVVATLRRGVTLKGRVETADGKPVASGFLISRHYLGSGWETHSEFLPVRDGRFEIPGCDPNRTEPYWFWDHKSLQGAVAHLSGDDEAVIIRLAPLGFASMRFVDDQGKPARVPGANVYLVVRPGADRQEPWDKDTPIRLTQNADFQGLQIDAAKGVVTAKALVPGATYVVETYAGHASKPFTVPAGQHIRLPDVVIEPPKPRKR
jgi:RNA polymerase sigma factor (sigma-70 family)